MLQHHVTSGGLSAISGGLHHGLHQPQPRQERTQSRIIAARSRKIVKFKKIDFEHTLSPTMPNQLSRHWKHENDRKIKMDKNLDWGS
jgi:hypothetical protein